MIKYLVINLSDNSTSYCHYENSHNDKLISLEHLKAGILFAMKENLIVQVVYPNYNISKDYSDVIESINHCKIVPATNNDTHILNIADIIVFNKWSELQFNIANINSTWVIRTSKDDFFLNYKAVWTLLENGVKVNIVITDIDSFIEEDFNTYKNILNEISDHVLSIYASGQSAQLNLLTDRMILRHMNNCAAGDENITLAPDGKFYVCPAFYYSTDGYSIGSLEQGLNIKNSQLYKFKYAPICEVCDAFQCRRCVWLNRKTTLEVNTPSHEQCVVAHIERNASRKLLYEIRKHGAFLPEQEISEISYLDPFDVRKKW